MPLTARHFSTLLAAVGFLLALPVVAQTATPVATPTGTSVKQLSTQYRTLAGSTQNADALVTGLRDGSSVTLSSGTTGTNAGAPSATFTPVTGKMGYGNINIALALAKADLTKQGITNPTPAQLAAALNGGVVTGTKGSTSMVGVLTQRQSGMGWGAIAKSMGVKLGSVVSASKTNKTGKADASSSHGDGLHNANGHGNSNSGGSHGNSGGGGGKH